jgi:flagellar basal-body rod protein FlgC
MSFWRSLKISSAALYAQRLRMDVISNNVANAETTSVNGQKGVPYQRQDVVFTTDGKPTFLANLMLVNRRLGEKGVQLDGVKVSKLVTDETAGPRVYDPTHPDAGADGYVNYPNVNLAVEMTNMLSATRSYEASLSVVDQARAMAQKALEIGR